VAEKEARVAEEDTVEEGLALYVVDTVAVTLEEEHGLDENEVDPLPLKLGVPVTLLVSDGEGFSLVVAHAEVEMLSLTLAEVEMLLYILAVMVMLVLRVDCWEKLILATTLFVAKVVTLVGKLDTV